MKINVVLHTPLLTSLFLELDAKNTGDCQFIKYSLLRIKLPSDTYVKCKSRTLRQSGHFVCLSRFQAIFTLREFPADVRPCSSYLASEATLSGPGALCNTPDLNRNVEPLDRTAEEEVIKEESELTCQYLEPSSFYVSNITNWREEAGGRVLCTNKSCRLRLLCV